MSNGQRNKVIGANIMSIYRYGIAQYTGETQKVRNRVRVSIMNSLRSIRGFKRGHNSNEEVLDDLGQDDPDQLILREAVKFIHGIIHRKSPLDLFK